ncbi:hypothetical protein SAMN05216360_12337 [Methylobacterium phyllostachyos]|uniref:Uncharacterized protein n=1 Tax=Methylobacterium phyllostachyos TaxID=582672 RepID=A0A1H0JPY1_9HYPH|nr:hypothetical protein SAMN05216360_12337 [Methylobacterium phyllostachyos]
MRAILIAAVVAIAVIAVVLLGGLAGHGKG